MHSYWHWSVHMDHLLFAGWQVHDMPGSARGPVGRVPDARALAFCVTMGVVALCSFLYEGYIYHANHLDMWMRVHWHPVQLLDEEGVTRDLQYGRTGTHP